MQRIQVTPLHYSLADKQLDETPFTAASEVMKESSTSVSNCRSTENSNKSVSFGVVIVSEHQVVLGDNPSCSSGPPIQISWDAFRTRTFVLDTFEDLKGSCGKRRREKEMMIPRAEREDMLVMSGIPRKAMQDVMITNLIMRDETMKNLEAYRRRRKISRFIRVLLGLGKR